MKKCCYPSDLKIRILNKVSLGFSFLFTGLHSRSHLRMTPFPSFELWRQSTHFLLGPSMLLFVSLRHWWELKCSNMPQKFSRTDAFLHWNSPTFGMGSSPSAASCSVACPQRVCFHAMCTLWSLQTKAVCMCWDSRGTPFTYAWLAPNSDRNPPSDYTFYGTVGAPSASCTRQSPRREMRSSPLDALSNDVSR